MFAFRTICFITACAAAVGAVVAAPKPKDDQGIPLMVGGTAHGARFIDALSDLGIGNFVWIPKNGDPTVPAPWDKQNDILADVDACKKHGLYFLISQRRGMGKSYKPGGGEYGGDTTPEILSAPTVREIAHRAGPLFAGLHAEEMDADLLQNGIRVSSRSRIPEVYRFTDRAGGRKCFEDELARIGRIYHSYARGVKYYPNMCVSLHHSGWRSGGDVVFAELLESLPTTELQFAYLRGGARQFGKDWGVWVSPWYRGKTPCEDRTQWPGAWTDIGAGHSLSAFRRCLYLSYGSGARVLTVQQTEPLLSGDGKGGLKPASWGTELKSFWDYAKQHTERMDPIVPLALLVDKDNGWAPANIHGNWIDHETIWGKLPIDRADKMLSSYLDVLLPDFERNAPGWWDLGITYPGYFASTPAGAFDIVSSDIFVERLSHYPNVVVMADIEMDKGLLDTLKSYVRGGGNLYVNAWQMRHREAFVQDPEFLGATIGMSHQWTEWSKSDLLMRRIYTSTKIVRKLPVTGVPEKEFAEPWYACQDVQPTTAQVVADDGAGNPILLRHRYGSGSVYLSTPEYMMEGFGTQKAPLGFFKSLVLGLAKSSPVRVTAPDSDLPPADISWVASRQSDSVLVTLANHSKSPRQVQVTWSGPSTHASLEVGVGPMDSKSSGRTSTYTLTIAPEDVAVVRVSGAGK